MSIERAYPKTPLVGIGAVIFKNDTVLLIKRASPPRKGEWSLPGGLQDVGETIYEAAAREVFEETGVSAEIKGLAGIVDSIEHDASGHVRYHYSIIDVWGSWISGSPKAQDDAIDAGFFSTDEIDSLGLWDEAHRIITEARNQRSRKP